MIAILGVYGYEATVSLLAHSNIQNQRLNCQVNSDALYVHACIHSRQFFRCMKLQGTEGTNIRVYIVFTPSQECIARISIQRRDRVVETAIS